MSRIYCHKFSTRLVYLFLLWMPPTLGLASFHASNVPPQSLTADAAFQSKRFHVLLDPGHGGSDHGAVRNQVFEARLVMQVANKITLIAEQDKQIQIELTRSSDSALSLLDRKIIAEKKTFDLFVSLHANTALDPRAHGVEFYFQNSLPFDEVSRFLSHREAVDFENTKVSELERGDLNDIIKDLERSFHIHLSQELARSLAHEWPTENVVKKKRPVRQAPFFLISNIALPSVLVEMGYLSNPQEFVQLNTPKYQNQMARNIYNGLLKFKESMDKSAKPPLD